MNNFDPQTGLPINQGNPAPAPIGYDPQTGAPIYAANTQAPVYEQPVQPQAPVYEQPVYAQTPQYEQAPQYGANIPADKPAKKKGHGALIAILLVVAIIAVGAAIFFLLIFPKLGGGSAKDKVFKSFEKTFAADNMVAEYLGSESLTQNAGEEPYQVSFNLTLDSISGDGIDSEAASMVEGVGISNGIVAFDPTNSNIFMSAGVNYAGVMDLITMTFLLNEDGIAVTSPELFGGYVGATADYMSSEMGVDYASLFSAVDSSSTDEMEELVKDFLEKSSVESADSETLSLGGKDVKCSGYTVTFAYDDINSFINDLAAQMEGTGDISLSSSDVTDDVVFTVYLDKSNRLVKIVFDDTTISDLTLDGEVAFLGGTYPMDNVEGTVSLGVAGAGSVEVTIDSATDRTDTSTDTTTHFSSMGSTITLSSSVDISNGEYSAYIDLASIASIDMNGTYADVKAGTSYNMNIDSFTLSFGGLNVALSGSIGMAPYTGSFATPDGTFYDISDDAAGEAFSADVQAHLENNDTLTSIISEFAMGNESEPVYDDYTYDIDDDYTVDDEDYTADNLPDFEANLATDYYYYQELFDSEYKDYYDYLTDYDTFIELYRLYDGYYRDACQITFSYFLFEYHYYLDFDYDDYADFAEYMADWYNLV